MLYHRLKFKKQKLTDVIIAAACESQISASVGYLLEQPVYLGCLSKFTAYNESSLEIGDLKACPIGDASYFGQK